MPSKSIGLLIGSILLICIGLQLTETAPTKEFYFSGLSELDQAPPESAIIENKDTNIKAANDKNTTLEDLAQFFKDQQHLTNDGKDSVVVVGQNGQTSGVNWFLAQLPYGEEMQGAYNLFLILQNAGISPTAMMQMITNSIYPTSG